MVYITIFLSLVICILSILSTYLMYKMYVQKKQINLVISKVLHGIQTPLTIMKGELDLFRIDSNSKQLVSSLDKSIDRLAHYVTQQIRV